MKSLLCLLLLKLCLSSVNSVLHLHDVVLEPIYRFTDTSANPMQALYFTKLPQFQSITQNSALLNISKFNAVRGLTQEMFLKDLGCGVNTCQGLPIEVVAVYNVIDSEGRLKFELTPSSTDKVLGKAGYLATKEAVGLISYDEYYSEEDGMFAYVNGKYPNQFGACQLVAYQRYRYKHVRTLGYAFTAVVIPNNLPIYTIFGFDDGLPEPTTVTTSPASTTPKTSTQVFFGTNPIWTIHKNSSDGIQGLGAVNLPWTPPVSAIPLEQTNICLFTGNFSLLSKCGAADRVLQYFDSTHTYFGFIDLFKGDPDTFIYSYIGFAFRSAENICKLPLVPIRELYKEGVGYNAVAGDDYSDLSAAGFRPPGRVLGYTIDCSSAQNGGIIADIPDYMFTNAPIYYSTTASLPSTTSSSGVGFYVDPAVIVIPNGPGKEQGSWWDPDGSLNSSFSFANTTNVCLFTANSTVLPKCGYASTLYLYYDISDNFYFVGIESFGRNVTSTVIGIAFQSEENVCGLKLVPIRELYTQGVGYYVVAGDNYADLVAAGYSLTGNVLGYTADCNDASGSMVYGTDPKHEFTTSTTLMTTTATVSPTITSNRTDLVDIWVSVAYNVSSTSGENGYWWGTNLASPYSIANPIHVCLFTANSTFLPQCGPTATLYQFLDADTKFYFFGISSVGRNVSSSVPIGLAFRSADNVCGLNLKPLRELYKEGVGYTVITGDKYDTLIDDGYNLTGNIMGYAIRCKNATDKMICGHLPSYNWTTISAETTTSQPITSSTAVSLTTPNISDTVDIWVSAAYNVSSSSGENGYWWGTDLASPYSIVNPIHVCLFTANSTFLPQCGPTATLYQFLDVDKKFYFFGISSVGRNVQSSTPIGLAFSSADNVCGLNLKPLRELYKEGVGYTVVAGDKYDTLLADGYNLTGNIMGYSVRCKNATDKMLCGNLPTYNWTTVSAPTTTFTPTQTSTKVSTTVTVPTTTTEKTTTAAPSTTVKTTTTEVIPTTSCIGTWSEWQDMPGAVCSDTCGKCGNITRHRVCEPSGCECSGESGIDIAPCNDGVCYFPRDSCCEPYRATVIGNRHACAVPTTTPAPTTTTPCSGEWSEWQDMPGAVCSDTCGKCGNITRHRVCEPSGCECSGESGIDIAPCNDGVCYFPRDSCCDPYRATVIGNRHACAVPTTTPAPTTTTPCSGEWSDWEVIPGSVCNDTCGNCGALPRQRTCLTCGCVGDTNDIIPCNDIVCLAPRSSCCSPYVRKLNLELRVLYCG